MVVAVVVLVNVVVIVEVVVIAVAGQLLLITRSLVECFECGGNSISSRSFRCSGI